MNHKQTKYTIPVYRLQLVQEGQATAAPVTGPAELAFQMKEIAMADREHMAVVFLDTKNRPIGRHLVSVGTVNGTPVQPRDVFRAALVPGALLIILAEWVAIFALSRYVSLASICASFTLPFATFETLET